MDYNNNNIRGQNPLINDSTVDFSRSGEQVEFSTLDRDSWKVMVEKLYHDMAHLFSKESALIKVEMSEKIREVKTAGTSVVIGGVLLFVGVITLAMTAIFLLARVIPVWSASALVTAAFLIVGYVMVRTALSKLEADKIKPRQSLETLGEIKTSFKERINEFKLHH